MSAEPQILRRCSTRWETRIGVGGGSLPQRHECRFYQGHQGSHECAVCGEECEGLILVEEIATPVPPVSEEST